VPKQDWQALTRLTRGTGFEIERVRLVDQDVAIEGRFEVPPLAQLASDDQVFVAAFVRCHGSIKEMEKFFGVSYPTIKNRLNRIGALLPFAEIEPGPGRPAATSSGELLSQLERGTLSVDEVLRQLRQSEEQK
jgi:hypothetical protein